ncbi:hypothetical protein OESDEN_10816 [Oesophagostomum dentatum]|uniref:Uncharacterized protein n=1 Tax=Oesophagostomum dentatum TaxID=61180 RepID=A0A0B1SZL7_OESDE|nr:hypothetical protein OESDEN_10816 [Oesophagostomum dentatum]
MPMMAPPFLQATLWFTKRTTCSLAQCSDDSCTVTC